MSFEILSNPPAKRNAKYWLDSAGMEERLETYYSGAWSHHHRKLLAQEILYLPQSVPLRILEFGAFGGANLRILSEKLSRPFELVATDPNPIAVDFLRRKMPHVRAFTVRASDFSNWQELDSGHFHVGLLIFVLSFLPAREAKSVVEKMATLCDRLYLYDGLLNSSRRSFAADAKGNRPGNVYYYHPYRRWLENCGFKIEKIIEDPNPQLARGGMLCATRRAVS